MCFTGHSTHLVAAAGAEREREREREKERERIAAASSDLYLRPGGEWLSSFYRHFLVIQYDGTLCLLLWGMTM